MSLGGIAIAIGAMIDAAIIMIENAHKHLEQDSGAGPRTEVLIAPPRRSAGRCSSPCSSSRSRSCPSSRSRRRKAGCSIPLAFTKTFAMGFAALTSVLVVPFLMVLFIRGRIPHGGQEPHQPLPHLGVSAVRPASSSGTGP